MALFHQPVSKTQIAQVLGMSIATFFRYIKRYEIKFDHHSRLSPKEAEECVIRLGYDPSDEILIQRARKVQLDPLIGFD